MRLPVYSDEMGFLYRERIIPWMRPWSIITRMESKSFDGGRLVKRSIEH
jgi:hypothetical protein